MKKKSIEAIYAEVRKLTPSASALDSSIEDSVCVTCVAKTGARLFGKRIWPGAFRPALWEPIRIPGDLDSAANELKKLGLEVLGASKKTESVLITPYGSEKQVWEFVVKNEITVSPAGYAETRWFLLEDIEALRKRGEEIFDDSYGAVFDPSKSQPVVGCREVFSDLFTLPLKTPTLPPATQTNCYVLGEERRIVVDPGAALAETSAPLCRFLDQTVSSGNTVEGVFLTHHHRDHMGGALLISERYNVPIIAHEETLRLLPELDGKKILSGAKILDVWEAIYTPGHAPGHLCLWDDSRGLLIAGDMVAGMGTILVDPTEGSMSDYINSLRTLASLSPRWVFPAHGDALFEGQEVLEKYVEHRLWREARVIDALKEKSPSSLQALLKVVYSDVSAGVQLLAERSLLSHLAKLTDEDRVHKTSDRTPLYTLN